nr:metallophosphoesterase [Atopomonas sediminilitoris]
MLGYDLIGDIHGCARTLERLLSQLGYGLQDGVWQHPTRRAIFLGDLLDRGPRIREVVRLVRGMVDAGFALCIMGNHEYNALGWYTHALPGSGRQFVREHNARHERIIRETLDQYADYPQEWADDLAWLQKLPLFIDGGNFRVVHACWDATLIEPLRQLYPDGRIDEHFLQASCERASFARQTLDRLLRGTDMALPHGMTLTGSDGFTRAFFRTKFWEENPQTYGDIVFQPDGLPDDVAQLPLSAQQRAGLLTYGATEPPLFVGHYWQSGKPAPIRPNLACLDYSAVKYGQLVAYRFDGERHLHRDKFVAIAVPRPEDAA